MFRADPSHSGSGTGNPTLNPTLLWKHTTGKYVASSPAVVNGVVYIGSYDNSVYALGGPPTSSNILFVTIGAVSAVVIIILLIFLLLRRNSKEKPTSLPSTT